MKNLSRNLRTNQTDAEQLLWKHLRNRLFMGTKFRRQQIIESYIVDFVCFEQRLIVEIDGGQHADQVERDARRTVYLESQGFRVVRFWNNEALNNIEGVLETIRSELISPHPAPLPQGERETCSWQRGEEVRFPHQQTPCVQIPSPLAGEGRAGTWSRGPLGCDRGGTRKHARTRHAASRSGVASIGQGRRNLLRPPRAR